MVSRIFNMGRFYQIGLKNKSEKNINKVNGILEKEFNVKMKIFDDGFKQTTFISQKYMKEEFEFVKCSEEYSNFNFSSRVSQEELTYEQYLIIRFELFDLIGFSQRYKISSINENEAVEVLALSKMVNSEKYKNLFIINQSKTNYFICYETDEIVNNYCKHFS